MEQEEKSHCPTCICNKKIRWKTKEEILAMRGEKFQREESLNEPLFLDIKNGFVEIMS